MSEAAASVDGPARRGRPAALGFIYAAILMNVMSMGVIIPVFPSLVKSLSHTGDAGGARIMGVFAAAWALMSLVAAPIFGNLSDRFGRRPVLLVSMFGLAFDYVVMALAPSIAWLFIGRVISGITASSGAAAGAYVADVSGEHDRARNFGRFQAAANAGILFGPALSGAITAFGPHLPGPIGSLFTMLGARGPFWVAAGLAFANGLFGLFALPESLSHERRAPFSWRRANPIGAIALLFSHAGLLGMAAIVFLCQFAGQSFNSIFQFYTHYRFDWGPTDFALLAMGLGGGSILVQSFLAGWTAEWLGERGAVLLGLVIQVGAFLCAGLAPTPIWFWVSMGVFMISGVANASLISLLSKRVGVDQQGQLQGSLQILFGLTGLVAPLAFTNLFAWAIGPGKGLDLPGAPFVVGAALTAVAVLMAIIYARPIPGAPVALIAPESFAE
ncbi:MAG TPA: MFS transporter [Caulobacteraceae bacterium]|nr:MFS transporter [Caulobacteraceae bacterium]